VHVRAIGIGLAVDSHGGYAHLARCAHHPQGYLAAVGNQYLFHGGKNKD
jgi:hypothetical protein